MEQDKIYLGDCLELMKEIPDKSIDLIVTDPPYLVTTTGAGIYKKSDKEYVKELEKANITNGFSAQILDELCRVMKKINIYLFCSQEQIISLLDYFVTQRKCNYNILSWHKVNPVPACGNKYLTDTEFVLFFREKGVKLYGSVETKSTYWVTPLNTKDKKVWGHPTIKPIGIVETLVTNSSDRGGVILDPFIGSGTTAIACIKNNRHFIGFEIDDNYYKTACKRIETHKSQLTIF